MKIFVLNGHKYYPFSQGRLNRTIFNRILEIIKPDNEVKTTIVENGYELNDEVGKFLWADIIIIQTPINWFSFPGLFKSYIDNVYKHGSFYGQSKEYGQGGLLTGKKYMYSLTMNSPQEAFNNPSGFYNGKSLDEVIYAMHKLQDYCGLEKLKTFAVYDVVKHPDITRFLIELDVHIKSNILNIH